MFRSASQLCASTALQRTGGEVLHASVKQFHNWCLRLHAKGSVQFRFQGKNLIILQPLQFITVLSYFVPVTGSTLGTVQSLFRWPVQICDLFETCSADRSKYFLHCDFMIFQFPFCFVFRWAKKETVSLERILFPIWPKLGSMCAKPIWTFPLFSYGLINGPIHGSSTSSFALSILGWIWTNQRTKVSDYTFIAYLHFAFNPIVFPASMPQKHTITNWQTLSQHSVWWALPKKCKINWKWSSNLNWLVLCHTRCDFVGNTLLFLCKQLVYFTLIITPSVVLPIS